MILTVNLNSPYQIIIERGALGKVSNYLDLNHQVLILTDDGIPHSYIEFVEKACPNHFLYTIKQGEASKSMANFSAILTFMADHHFTRKDCLIALGGGVVGDLGGFVASTYMRGITFYNIPTTLLAQVDSSIGGKTAIDFAGYKNLVGSFYQPKKVIIDPNVLDTLDERMLHAGLVEALKMAVTFDLDLFNLINDANNLKDHLEEIITKALTIKKMVVEQDVKEEHLRQVLNFGHTFGHAFESYYQGKYYHGECVANGMLYMVTPDVREKLLEVLKKYQLPFMEKFDLDKIMEYFYHDKKADGNFINIVFVNEIGSFEIKKVTIPSLKQFLEVKINA